MSKVKFGDVVEEYKGKIDQKNNPYEFYVAGDHMDTDDLTIRRKGRFATDDVGPAFIREFKKGQVLYGSRRTYLRKIAVADFDGVTANTTFVLETKDENVLRQRLIPFIMYTESFTEWSIKKSKGSTNPYVLFKDLADYEFELPCIEKQDELVDLLWSMVAVKDSYNNLLLCIEEAIKAQYIKMFGDPHENPFNWPIKSFCDVATIDATMTDQYDYYAEYPHIGIDSIEKDTGILSGYRTVREDNVISPKYIFGPEHILYSKIRPVLNKVALPDFEGLCSADCYPILVKKDVCDRLFLAHVLRSDFFLEYILAYSTRSQMPKVNRKQIGGFTFPCPPIEMQKSFVKVIEQGDRAKLEINRSLSEQTALYKQILTEELDSYVEDKNGSI